MNEITTIREPSTALIEQNPIADLLQKCVATGVTADNAAAMRELAGLYKDMEDRAAAKAFAAAKVALQAELPTVLAKKEIKSKDGTVRSKYAPYEHIMAAIDPYLVRHGFSVSFDIEVEDGGKRLMAICKLTHIAGHTETNKFSVRVGQGPPGTSEAQADGSARTYARRGALCDALNIVIDHDDDARNLGGFITAKQAASLRARVKATDTEEWRFLKFAGAQSFETIHSARYASVDEELLKKEARAAAAAAANPTRQPAPPEPAEDREAMDKQDFVDDCYQRKAAATTSEEVDSILAEIMRNEQWLGKDKARELAREIAR